MADKDFKVQGPDDPKGIGAVSLALKDGYEIHSWASQEGIDFMAAGLNGYGDFVIQGKGLQVIRIPDKERYKLAAYLLSPLLEVEPLYLEEAEKQAAIQRAMRGETAAQRAARREKDKASGKKGVIAMP